MPNEERATTTRIAQGGNEEQRGFVLDVAKDAAAGLTVTGVTAAAKLAVEKLKPPKK